MKRILPILLVACLSCGTADDAGNGGPRSTGNGRSETSAGEGGRNDTTGANGSSGSVVRDSTAPRVVFLGTSLTAGYGLPDEAKRFTDVIQEMADSARIPVLVVNAGVSGDTSAGGLRRIDWALADGAAVLVVELGANDGLRGLEVPALKANLVSIIERARTLEPGIQIVLAGMEAPPNMGARYTAEFREAYRTVAREQHVTLIPFLLEGVAGIPQLNQGDQIHPNPEGHRRVAHDVIWPVLEPVLREVRKKGR